jgi:hypothetical protein
MAPRDVSIHLVASNVHVLASIDLPSSYNDDTSGDDCINSLATHLLPNAPRHSSAENDNKPATAKNRFTCYITNSDSETEITPKYDKAIIPQQQLFCQHQNIVHQNQDKQTQFGYRYWLHHIPYAN